jgi:hypothetical protein
MDIYDVKRLALVLATQAEIEGMKADNAFCEAYGDTPNFKKQDFDDKAERIRILASIHNDEISLYC